MELIDKLMILANSAKYDSACTSSGVDRGASPDGIGSAVGCGICHSFASDGRCISLLKVLMTNYCIYDCKYCINRTSNDVKRTMFTPRELAELTINFYRRNYIEGLFLSSGIIKSPDYTTEKMIEAIRILREEYGFCGYIHAKAIPGTDQALINRLGLMVDRLSVNIELPSQNSLKKLAPDKSKHSILKPMGFITSKIKENKADIVKYKSAPTFAGGGQATQMIIGATPDTDYQIINLASALYKKYSLRRVFYSAYMPVSNDLLLPSMDTKPPLMREHRLYQADWLIRVYNFEADELLDEAHPNFNPYMDPKCNWAVNHLELFPVEVNKAPFDMLMRVPGIGKVSAQRIITARRYGQIDFEGLKKIGAVMKRAVYFITCSGKMAEGIKFEHQAILNALISENCRNNLTSDKYSQISMFDDPRTINREDIRKCLTGQM